MEKLKVLGVCASPREGTSKYLLDRAIRVAVENSSGEVDAEIYSLKGKRMGPCVDCGGCKNGNCVIKDDFQTLSTLWMEADVIIYSVPVYHLGMPGQLKCFIDRLGQTMESRFTNYYDKGLESFPKMLKVVGNIVQGMHMVSGQESTMISLINHALVMQSIPVTGDIWESYLGSGGWTQNKLEKNVFEQQVEQGDFTAQTMVRSSESVGKRCIQMAEIIRAGIFSMQDALSNDMSYRYICDKVKQK